MLFGNASQCVCTFAPCIINLTALQRWQIDGSRLYFFNHYKYAFCHIWWGTTISSVTADNKLQPLNIYRTHVSHDAAKTAVKHKARGNHSKQDYWWFFTLGPKNFLVYKHSTAQWFHPSNSSYQMGLVHFENTAVQSLRVHCIYVWERNNRQTQLSLSFRIIWREHCSCVWTRESPDWAVVLADLPSSSHAKSLCLPDGHRRGERSKVHTLWHYTRKLMEAEQKVCWAQECKAGCRVDSAVCPWTGLVWSADLHGTSTHCTWHLSHSNYTNSLTNNNTARTENEETLNKLLLTFNKIAKYLSAITLYLSYLWEDGQDGNLAGSCSYLSTAVSAEDQVDVT